MGSNPTLCANANGTLQRGVPFALACKMGRDSKGGRGNAAVRRLPTPGSGRARQRRLEGQLQADAAENPTLCAKTTGHPETGCPVVLACKKGGIRRAGEETPQCGVCPPRGAAERGSAGRKASCKRMPRRIPPCCARRAGGTAATRTLVWSVPVVLACKKGGIRRAGEETPQCGVCPPRGAAERRSTGFAGQW